MTKEGKETEGTLQSIHVRFRNLLQITYLFLY